MKTYTAIFHPQAWIGDYAVDVDPEGETEWDVTSFMLSTFPDEVPADNDYESDFLAQDPSAPEWIRDWSGPFWVEIREC